MLLRILPVVLAAALFASGCRGPKCHGELESDDLYKLSKLVDQGEDPCPEHVRPTLELSREGLKLNQRLIAAPDQLAGNHPRRVQPLFAELKNAREIWKQIHPAQMFEADPTLKIDSDVESDLAASVIITTAFAGYPAQKIQSGGSSFHLFYDVPGPPDPESPRYRAELRLGTTKDGRRTTSLGGPRIVVVDSTPVAVSFENVPASVKHWCRDIKPPCADVLVISATGPFDATMTLLQNVASLPVFGGQMPLVRFAGDGQ